MIIYKTAIFVNSIVKMPPLAKCLQAAASKILFRKTCQNRTGKQSETDYFASNAKSLSVKPEASSTGSPATSLAD